MTDHDDTRDTRDTRDAQREYDAHALSGAYAVDALDDLERARFEEHLRQCPDCRAEVDSLRETAAALSTDAVEPPAGLRADVLAGIEAIRPLPPLTEHGRNQPAPVERPRRPWLLGTGPMLVAAALVLVALVSTAWLRPWAGDDEPGEMTATERVLAADDADRIVQRFPDGSRATVVFSRSEGRAVLLTEDMALAPDGSDYQLWLQAPQGSPVSAGLMPDQADATVLLEGDASRATWVGITVEPDGGSAQPTTDPIAAFDLPT
ncbi:anti-sigma factor [Nocardioides immobilis]|uniref:Regulator of SigK n=1 Tax=Nocardioides immobilis TaxID=2049295 RepID=A0A417Y0A2_9ACTN|nr:anti-sigma factor [Nocardioides immobilis]RHW26011.1 anti-sigma factor [Nocardioides immobilis]